MSSRVEGAEGHVERGQVRLHHRRSTTPTACHTRYRHRDEEGAFAARPVG